MGFLLLLGMAPFLVVFIGMAIGYFFKPIVLKVLSVPIIAVILLGVWILLTVRELDLAFIFPVLMISIGLALLLPMWIVCLIKAKKSDTSSQNANGATLDTKNSLKQ